MLDPETILSKAGPECVTAGCFVGYFFVNINLSPHAHSSYEDSASGAPIVIGLDLKTRRLLTSRINVLSAGGVDRLERFEVALFRFAHAGAGDAAIKFAAG